MQALKKILPTPVKRLLRRGVKAVRYNARRLIVARAVANGQPMRVILGAAETFQPGWYSTNESWLDITNPNHWRAVFGGRKLLTHAVAEHVFEHLTHAECAQALQLIHDHLRPQGRLRIAVPDGYHPDPTYLRHVGINGIGDDAADHKQLLTVDILADLLRAAGFTPHHLEGYRADGTLVQAPYNPDDGLIRRSRAFHIRNPQDLRPWAFVDAETSLIVDGVKA